MGQVILKYKAMRNLISCPYATKLVKPKSGEFVLSSGRIKALRCPQIASADFVLAVRKIKLHLCFKMFNCVIKTKLKSNF